MDGDIIKYKFEKVEEKARLDADVTEKLHQKNINLSRSKIQNLIKNGKVKINNNKCLNPSQQLKHLDMIEIDVNITNSQSSLIAKDIDFEVVYNDESLAVINKPAGLTTHPGAGNNSDTLANGLLYKYKNQLSSVSGSDRPGIVHRLDKDTSGLIIIAKNDESHYLLSKLIQQKLIQRKYLAFIYGSINPESGIIEKNIKRNRVNRLKMTTTKSDINSRSAITKYKTIEKYNDGFASLIECELQTGRTHQIRVHLESEKHSIIGDQTYNSCQKQIFNCRSEQYYFIKNFPRQALHSYFLKFEHPVTKKELSFNCPLPSDMSALQKNLQDL